MHSPPKTDPKSVGSQASKSSVSSYEEGDFIDYDIFSTKDEQPHHTKEYYYQEYPYVRPTQKDFEKKQVKHSRLFDKTKKSTAGEPDTDQDARGSILVSGFGMRNVDSFQKLLEMSHEERRKWDLRKRWRDEYGRSVKSKELSLMAKPTPPSARTETTATSTSTETRSSGASTDYLTQTEPTTDRTQAGMKHLDYLLGLERERTEVEEEPEPFKRVTHREESEEEYNYSTCKSIREAQRYFRVHRIFECFQFIVAHLLSANAENPIEFILNLLNRCLLYRSGMGEPPLLYERKHISRLFDLMDRMQVGFIDRQQYITGMKTLGICSYNEHPEENDEGLISKQVFVEEAYEAELAILDDMIKRKVEGGKKKPTKVTDVSDPISYLSITPPYFIPSDLFKNFPKAYSRIMPSEIGE